jgi:hypothetical protein
MPKGTPSKECPYVLVPEDQVAFDDPVSAVREAKRQWAAQEPAQRIGYFIAMIQAYAEPDYEVDAAVTPVWENSGRRPPAAARGRSKPPAGAGTEGKSENKK